MLAAQLYLMSGSQFNKILVCITWSFSNISAVLGTSDNYVREGAFQKEIITIDVWEIPYLTLIDLQQLTNS